MKGKFQLASVDMMTFLIQAMVGIRLMRLPTVLTKVAGNDAWISVILGGAMVLVVSLMLYWLGIKFPGKNGSEIVVKVFGGYIGKIGLILIAIHTTGSMGLALEVFSNSLKLYLLATTPVAVIAGIMILLSLYAFTRGLKTISALVNILLPQLLFWMAFILILPVKKMEPQNLLPIMSNGIKPIILGSLEVVDALYGFTIIAYIMPYFKDRKSTLLWIFPGVIIASSIFLAITTACTMVFGSDEIVRLLFPTLTLAKSIELEIKLIERAESLFMITWVIICFIMMTLSFFVSYHNLKVLFPKKNKLLIWGQLPFVWLFLRLSQNVAQVHLYSQYINYLGRAIMLGIVPLMVLVVLVREKVKKNAKA